MRRVVGDRDHAADEAVDEVVRQQPARTLVPDAPPALVALEREREAQQARVHGEVDGAGEDARAGDDDLRGWCRGPRCEREGAARRERGERQGADVEQDAVERRAARAPLDDRS